MVRPAFDIAQLTVGERLELITTLWESLRGQPDALPLAAAERALIAERAAEHARDPGSAIPWETVRAELLADQAADDTPATPGRVGGAERGG